LLPPPAPDSAASAATAHPPHVQENREHEEGVRVS